MVKALASAVFCFCSVNLWQLLEFGTILPAHAKTFLTRLRQGGDMERPYMNKLSKSLEKSISFRVRIGSFGYLSKSAVVIIFSAVFENICTLLVVTKE